MIEFNNLLQRHNLSLKEISEELNIPYRTVQNWHLGLREPPAYLIKLINIYYAILPIIRQVEAAIKEI